jgi:glycosyltransferase involved in cell wall biosynthesis
MLSVTYALADQNPRTCKSIGILNLSLNLLRHLAAHSRVSGLTVLTNTPLADRVPLPPHARRERHDRAIAGPLRRMLWDQFGLYAQAARQPHEWLLLPKGYASFARRPPRRIAAIVADAMVDHYAHRWPRAMPRLERIYFTRSLQATLRRAAVVMTISRFTADEMRRLAAQWRIPCPDLVPVGIGFERPAAPPTAARDGAILALASRFPHKRTDLAVRYLARYQERADCRAPVHWVGAWPADLPWNPLPGWQRHERLDEADYRDLMGRCSVLIYTSEYEGFGMPPVEAALAGLAPVFSDIPALREVMLGTGFPFGNGSYESFAAAMDAARAATPATIADWADRLAAAHNWTAVTDRVVAAMERHST